MIEWFVFRLRSRLSSSDLGALADVTGMIVGDIRDEAKDSPGLFKPADSVFLALDRGSDADEWYLTAFTYEPDLAQLGAVSRMRERLASILPQISTSADQLPPDTETISVLVQELTIAGQGLDSSPNRDAAFGIFIAQVRLLYPDLPKLDFILYDEALRSRWPSWMCRILLGLLTRDPVLERPGITPEVFPSGVLTLLRALDLEVESEQHEADAHFVTLRVEQQIRPSLIAIAAVYASRWIALPASTPGLYEGVSDYISNQLQKLVRSYRAGQGGNLSIAKLFEGSEMAERLWRDAASVLPSRRSGRPD